MKAALAISDTSFSTAYLVATLLSGACLPFTGQLLDRFGARVMLPVIAAALGGACLWMSSVKGLVGLYVGFCMIRPLGQGSLTLVSTWLVGHWFERRRGMAMGLMGLGGSLSVMCIPQINYWVTAELGWRTSWIFLGVGVWSVLVLPALFFVRNRPEESGWLPDGRRPEEPDPRTTASLDISENGQADLKGDWTIDEAWRTATFWKLLAPLCTGSLVGTGLIFHQLSIFAERGLSGAAAVTTLSIQAVFASVFAIFFGYLTDRFPPRRLLAIAMICMAAAQLLLTSMSTLWLAIIYGMLLGTHGAIMRTAGNAVWVNFYGRLHQGSIRGIVLTFQIVTSALGPLPFALAKDYWGSYSFANLSMLILPLVSAVAVWTAHPPGNRQ